jgi:hypothetical protein
VLLPFFCDLDQNGVSAEKGDDADHDQVLERDEHVKLEPEEVVKTEDGTEAEVEPDAGRRERQVGDVDADFEPTDEHELGVNVSNLFLPFIVDPAKYAFYSWQIFSAESIICRHGKSSFSYVKST